MKKLFATLFAVLFIMTGTVFADNDKTNPGSGINPGGFSDRPGFDNGNAWWKGNSDGPGPNPCPNNDCHASGNFNFELFTIGGGIDLGLNPGDMPGITGGGAIAGGIGFGEGQGSVTTGTMPVFDFGWYEKNGKMKYGFHIDYVPVTLGSAEANLVITAGGIAKVSPIDADGYKGTLSQSLAQIGVAGDVCVYGLADASVFGLAVGGEANGAFSIGAVPGGLTTGAAGQYALGYVIGGAGALGLGSADFDGQISMYGYSYAANMYDVKEVNGFNVKTIGTQVGAGTFIDSVGDVSSHGLAYAGVDGAFKFGGAAQSTTILAGPGGGLSYAHVEGDYTGGGNLGCNTGATLDGYTVGASITKPGWNGSIQQSAAGMKVSVGPNNQPK